jgi:hypothetical protein
MKKGLILACLIMCISIGMSARNIKTKGGEVFKNVSISSVTPTGIDISFQKNNISFIKHIRFTDLSEEMQKEFAYDPKKAETYLANLEKHAEMVKKKYTAALLKQKEVSAKQHQLRSQIEAGAVNVLINVTIVKPDGVIGWADSVNSTIHSSGHMGKVFVYGLLGMSGTKIPRVIYPTGQSKYGFSCYAATLEQAVILKENANK